MPGHKVDTFVRPAGRHQHNIMSACGMQVFSEANQVTSSIKHYRIDWWTVLAVLLLCKAVVVLHYFQSESDGQQLQFDTVAT